MILVVNVDILMIGGSDINADIGNGELAPSITKIKKAILSEYPFQSDVQEIVNV